MACLFFGSMSNSKCHHSRFFDQMMSKGRIMLTEMPSFVVLNSRDVNDHVLC